LAEATHPPRGDRVSFTLRSGILGVAVLCLLRLGCSADTASSTPGTGGGGPAAGAPAAGGADAAPGTGGTGAPGTGGSSGGCAAGLIACGPVCVDLGSDPNNCGSCSRACAATEVCSQWQCAGTCAPTLTACGQSCVDLGSDPRNCGECGRDCGARLCVGGLCTCPSGLRYCNDLCVDPLTNLSHCGGCGQSCAVGEACSTGICRCASGLERCGELCVDTRSDAQNCGACGAACAPGLFCNAGECQSQACPAGQKVCGSTCVDVTTSMSNCGACGTLCLGECCNGVCVHTSSDPANCGECGRLCNSPGRCEVFSCMCPVGQAYCDSTCVSIESDPARCGGCDNACASGTSCEWGACICPGGLSYCDGACRPMSDCVVASFGEGATTTAPGQVWTGGDVCPGTGVFTSKATHYDLGNSLPHCSFPPAGLPQYFAAINEADYADAATCGACVRVYHPASGKTLDVMLVDECPAASNPEWCYAGSHHVDLNREAFAYFADPTVGVLDIQWAYVECPVSGNLQYAWKDGTSTYWTAITFRNHPLPITAVAYQNSGGVWRDLSRVDYNYWLDSQGFGIGPYRIRVTDTSGSVLEASLPTIDGQVATVAFQDLDVQLPGCQ
jgi:expansin (peptidoglycan-binding protein)